MSALDCQCGHHLHDHRGPCVVGLCRCTEFEPETDEQGYPA